MYLFKAKTLKRQWEKTPQKAEADKRKIGFSKEEREPKKKLTPEKGKTVKSTNQEFAEGKKSLDLGQEILEPSTSQGTKIPAQVSSDSEAEILLWVDKYKPTSFKTIIGQQGDQSCANKLLRWLKNWYKNTSDIKRGNYIINYFCFPEYLDEVCLICRVYLI